MNISTPPSANCMKIRMPQFGLISAIAASTAFLPHVLVMLGVFFFHPERLRDPTPIFIFFTIIARVVGDWLFWGKFFPLEMDCGENAANWRASVKDIVSSEPLAIRSTLDMVIDAAIDVTLVWLAFKASAPSLLILLTFSACQTVGGPIQGMLLRIFERKHLRLFSMVCSALAIDAALEINGVISRKFWANFLEQFRPSKSIQMLITLGAKCLLSGTSVIAKDTIAETIKMKILRSQTNDGS